MRALLLLLVTGMLCASQKLTLDQEQALITYNHKPSLAFTANRRMKTFATISITQAKELAAPLCHGEMATKLTHKNAYLFYEVEGEDCNLNINALDGAIIPMEALDE